MNKKSRNFVARPTAWITVILSLALIVLLVFSIVKIKSLESTSTLESAEVEVFEHLAGRYIDEMEFTVADKPTIKHMTGYGVSDEDGVLYITFDFATYEAENYNRIPNETRHGILYFQKDTERGTYGHAFSYHDDASYHPDGVYVKLDINY